MIIKSLELHNFKGFKHYKVDFSPITFIKGQNGIGKSTLGKEAHLFCVYGYIGKDKLIDLPNKDIKAKSCWVMEEIELNGTLYRIKRSYPTKLEIWEDNLSLKFATNAEAQLRLKQLFGDVNKFKRFRMIDKNAGINFLEEGQVALKKTLFSVSQDKLNEMRDKLAKIKYERDMYNKDKLNASPHYPSEERLNTLELSVSKLKGKLTPLTREKNEFENDIRNYTRKQGQLEARKKTVTWEKNQLLEDKYCYACKQSLKKDNQEEMLKQRNEELISLNEELKQNIDIIEESKEMLIQIQENYDTIYPNITRLQNLIGKLETRIKQKAYKYNSADVEIVKKAIKELDNISSKCLVQSIEVLEPIINSVLEKINFKLRFDVNAKGKFALILEKDGIKYPYNALSDGQKLVLQVSFKLALMLEQGEEGLMIADEGFSSLDKENLLHILTIIGEFPIQLIFMLHSGLEMPEGIKTVELQKENN
jgi:DNA repair exonuclease SbcCD ATPase subunit